MKDNSPWNAADFYRHHSVAMNNLLVGWKSSVGSEFPLHIAGHDLSLMPAMPLSVYPVRLSLRCAFGLLYLGVECSTLLPEYSGDILKSAWLNSVDGVEYINVMLMPWLAAAEDLLGIALVVDDMSFDWESSPGASGFVLTDANNDRIFIALEGDTQALISCLPDVRFRRCRQWQRVAMYWSFLVRGLSARDIARVAPGSVVMIDDGSLTLSLAHGLSRRRFRATCSETGAVVGSEILEGSLHMDGDGGEGLVNLKSLTFDVDVVLCRRSLSLDETERLREGIVLELDRAWDGRQVTLVSGGAAFARGVIVRVEDRMGVKILESWDGAPRHG